MQSSGLGEEELPAHAVGMTTTVEPRSGRARWLGCAEPHPPLCACEQHLRVVPGMGKHTLGLQY